MSDISGTKRFKLERLIRRVAGCGMTITATESELEQYGKEHFQAGLKRAVELLEEHTPNGFQRIAMGPAKQAILKEAE